MKTFKLISSILLVYFFSSCSEKESTTAEPPPTAEEYLQMGWDEFENQNYETALENFEISFQKDNWLDDAMSGAGWSAGYLSQLTVAVEYFTQGYNVTENNEDITAGFAFIYNAQKKYENSNEWALKVKSNWIFSHDVSVNINDVFLLIAENCFALGDFENSLIYVQILNPVFTCDIYSIEGRAALAAEIERLKGKI